jgi:CheY-like chemotaxis protein
MTTPDLLVPSVPPVADRAAPATRILVADDDPAICLLEATILQSTGFQVDTAPDGTAAWTLLTHHDYDLLVTDYRMPGISGIALARQLRLAQQALPIIVVSGSLETLDTARLRRDPWTRIHQFVRKPFSVVELLAAVHDALRLVVAPPTAAHHPT